MRNYVEKKLIYTIYIEDGNVTTCTDFGIIYVYTTEVLKLGIQCKEYGRCVSYIGIKLRVDFCKHSVELMFMNISLICRTNYRPKQGLGSNSDGMHAIVLYKKMGLMHYINGMDYTQSLIIIIKKLHPEPNNLDDLDDEIWEV